LEKIVEIDKPRNVWCKDCTIGKGCNIYPDRPNSCRTFDCVWLSNPDIPDTLRPDRIGVYGVAHGGYVKLVSDPDQHGFSPGPAIVAVLTGGKHALLMDGDTIKFICGQGLERPQRVILDWIL
jgi:hypothetical protein